MKDAGEERVVALLMEVSFTGIIHSSHLDPYLHLQGYWLLSLRMVLSFARGNIFQTLQTQ